MDNIEFKFDNKQTTYYAFGNGNDNEATVFVLLRGTVTDIQEQIDKFNFDIEQNEGIVTALQETNTLNTQNISTIEDKNTEIQGVISKLNAI